MGGYVNVWIPSPFGDWWRHKYVMPHAAVVPLFVNKYQAWRPTQYRSRDSC